MKISKIIDNAGFPVYENGGYECKAVDEFIDDIEVAALELESAAKAGRDSEAALAALQEETRLSKEKNDLLQSEIDRLGAENRELVASNSSLSETLDSQSEGASPSPDPRLQEELLALRNQKEIDAEHIARADFYSQGLEKTIAELNARIDELGAENRELLAYTQRFAATDSAPLPRDSSDNQPQHATNTVQAEEDSEAGRPLYQRKRLVRQPRHDL